MTTFRALITVPYMQPGDGGDACLRTAGVETVFDHWHGGRTEAEMIGLLRDVDAAI